jgi:hypothetical protein
MKGFIAGLTAIAAAVPACGGSSNAGTNTDREPLQLVVDEKPIVVSTGQSLVVQLFVIGHDAAGAVITSPDLPAFATIDASRLTLSPDRNFIGNYAITLVAKSGESSASATLHVSVDRDNSPPTVGAPNWGDDRGVFDMPLCSPDFHGILAMSVAVTDAEHDDVTMEAEVVPKGQAFTGEATHALTATMGVNHARFCITSDPFSSCIELPFTGLANGMTYSFAMRFRDQFGAAATRVAGAQEIGDGWFTQRCWEFTQLP